MSGDCYRILGLRVVVRSTSWEFATQAQRLFSSFPIVSGDGLSPDATISVIVAPPAKSASIRPFHFVYHGSSQVGHTTSYWQLFRVLEHQLDILLAARVDSHLLLHAGAVSRNGAGIILPGPSGSGKSSLTLALLQGQYSYCSDEIAVVDPATGELHPFPKPISIKDTSVFPDLAQRNDLWLGPEAGEKSREEPVWYVHAQDVASGSISEPVPVRFIIFPSYDPAAETQLQPLSAGLAMQQLIENSVNFYQFGGGGLDLLANLVEGAQCFSLTTASLKEATALIDELTRS